MLELLCKRKIYYDIHLLKHSLPISIKTYTYKNQIIYHVESFALLNLQSANTRTVNNFQQVSSPIYPVKIIKNDVIQIQAAFKSASIMSPAFTAVPRVLRDYARDEHQ